MSVILSLDEVTSNISHPGRSLGIRFKFIAVGAAFLFLSDFRVCSADDNLNYDFKTDYQWSRFYVPQNEERAFPGSFSVDAHGKTLDAEIGLPPSTNSGEIGFAWQVRHTDLKGEKTYSQPISGSYFTLSRGDFDAGPIDVESSTGANGALAETEVDFTDSVGSRASIYAAALSPPGPNSVTIYAVSPTVSGAAFAALLTNGEGPYATAFGGYADDRGYKITGAGDLSGGSYRTMVKIDYVENTNTIWLISPIIDEDISLKYGLSYRSSRAKSSTRSELNFAGDIGGGDLPNLLISGNNKLDVDGGGPAVSFERRYRPLSDLTLSLGGSLGLNYLSASEHEDQSIFFSGIDPIVVSEWNRRRRGLMGLVELSVGLEFPIQSNVALQVSGVGRAIVNSPSLGDSNHSELAFGVGIGIKGSF